MGKGRKGNSSSKSLKDHFNFFEYKGKGFLVVEGKYGEAETYSSGSRDDRTQITTFIPGSNFVNSFLPYLELGEKGSERETELLRYETNKVITHYILRIRGDGRAKLIVLTEKIDGGAKEKEEYDVKYVYVLDKSPGNKSSKDTLNKAIQRINSEGKDDLLASYVENTNKEMLSGFLKYKKGIFIWKKEDYLIFFERTIRENEKALVYVKLG